MPNNDSIPLLRMEAMDEWDLERDEEAPGSQSRLLNPTSSLSCGIEAALDPGKLRVARILATITIGVIGYHPFASLPTHPPFPPVQASCARARRLHYQLALRFVRQSTSYRITSAHCSVRIFKRLSDEVSPSH